MVKKNVIQDKSFDYALKAIELYKVLQLENEYIISKQYLRSSTSIGANIEEAIAAQSKKDFLHKINISLKEARESRYWLRLLDKSNLVSVQISSNLEDAVELIKILSAIVKTTKKGL